MEGKQIILLSFVWDQLLGEMNTGIGCWEALHLSPTAQTEPQDGAR